MSGVGILTKWTRKICAFVLAAASVVSFGLGLTACAENVLTLELSADEAYYIVTDCLEGETEVTIPASHQGKAVKAIAKDAFAKCDGLTSVSIPDSVVYIESNTFAACSNLQYTEKGNGKYLGNENNPYLYLAKVTAENITEVTIENECKVVDSAAFMGCANLKYTEKGNAKYLGNENNPYFCLAKAISTEIESVTIAEECKVIAAYAFNDCKKLQGISIPGGVLEIGRNAFYGCSKLKTATLSSGVMGVGIWAFGYCGLTRLSLPDSLINIKEHAFSYCQKLTSVRIPDSITSIAPYTFQGCYQLGGVTIGKKVTAIWQWAFADSGLRSVTIPDGVKTVGSSAFYGCGYLASATIPASVTVIGSNAFTFCGDLKNIRFQGTKAEWGKISKDGMWAYCVSAENVDCTDGSVEI